VQAHNFSPLKKIHIGIIYMTTTNSCLSSVNDCVNAQSNFQPDCFNLRVGSNPTTSSYDLALCNLVVTFTDVCCIANIAMDPNSSIVLQIPLIFALDCFLYRLNILNQSGTSTGLSGNPNITAFLDTSLPTTTVPPTTVPPTTVPPTTTPPTTIAPQTSTATPLSYYIIDGYLSIVIPGSFIYMSGNDSCTSSIMFNTFSIPVIKMASYCPCCTLCAPIQWAFGPGGSFATTTIAPSTTVAP
jgi:hypothetical protein